MLDSVGWYNIQYRLHTTQERLTMKFTKFDIRMFDKAREEAELSDYGRIHVGCVITYKGHIIGRGHNSTKTHPRQKRYNRRYRKFNNTQGEVILDSVHAEVSAANSVSYTTGIQIDWSKTKIFVFRIASGKKNGYGCAKPCPACTAMISDLGIKDIYYTDDDGYAYLRLDN